MILVRHLDGAFYFLIKDLEERAALRNLEETYSGSPIEIVERRDGLLIARVGTSRESTGGPGIARESRDLTIVNLELPARRSPAKGERFAAPRPAD